jgi:transcription elongation GreA/GreB family factor
MLRAPVMPNKAKTELDKRALLEAFKQQIETELQRATERARDAAEGATHAENRAEGDKDMRATEASYVARGHSERVAQLEQALARLALMQPKTFRDGDPIQLGAVVCLDHQGTQSWYFLIPVAGGQRVTIQGCEFQALTAQSPLGSALIGLVAGDEVEVTTPQGLRSSEIISVH